MWMEDGDMDGEGGGGGGGGEGGRRYGWGKDYEW